MPYCTTIMPHREGYASLNYHTNKPSPQFASVTCPARTAQDYSPEQRLKLTQEGEKGAERSVSTAPPQVNAHLSLRVPKPITSLDNSGGNYS